MSLLDIFTMAVRNLFKRKLRTILTVLGVVIGTAAITIMISLGVGVNMSFDAQIEQIGHEALRIDLWGASQWSPHDRAIEEADIAAISRLPNVAAVTPMMNTSLTFTSGRYVASVSITGIMPEAMEALGFNLSDGRMLEDGDEFSIVFGGQIPFEFRTPREHERNRMGGGGMFFVGGRGGGMMFSGGMMGGMMMEQEEPPIDVLTSRFQASFVPGFGSGQGGGNNQQQQQSNRVRPYTIEAVGVLSGDQWETSNNSFMPLDQVMQIAEDRYRHERQSGNQFATNPLEHGFERAVVFADSVHSVDTIMEQLEEMGFTNVWSRIEWLNHLRDSNANLETLLSAIGAVSMVIAAIGITNTMVMSIYERTKEIGVMKVIGASIKDIRRLFLVEAAMIGALGGVVGLGVSMIGSHLLNTGGFTFFMTTQHMEGAVVSHIPLWLYALGFGFSCAIGLISGFLPARRATKISALSAIRTD